MQFTLDGQVQTPAHLRAHDTSEVAVGIGREPRRHVKTECACQRAGMDEAVAVGMIAFALHGIDAASLTPTQTGRAIITN